MGRSRAYILAMSETTTALEPVPDLETLAHEERWEISAQWKAAWGRIKWVASGLIIVLGLLVVGQVFQFHQMFAAIHPAAGWAFTVATFSAIGWFVGRPLVSFLHTPRIAQAPNVDLRSKEIRWDDLVHRADYDLTYLKGMGRNPELADQADEIQRVRTDLTTIRNRMEKHKGSKSPTDFARELADFERDRIAALLKSLDAKVDSYVHKESLAVGAATAVSLNGSIDAFIVLWRNINMVSRISRLYYGRPSLRLTFFILRDVMGAVLLSRALDDITDAAGEALGGLIGKLGGMVAGPMMDGSVNALVTSKIGQLAKRRCRSFDVWSEATATRMTREVYEQVKKESSGLVGELVKVSGGFINATTSVTGAVVDGAVNVAGKVVSAPKSAWSVIQDTFVRKPSDKPEQ